jgi:hypothetical protein
VAIPWLDTLTLDVRYALRILKNSRGFAAVAILSLALGIGANIAVFSVVDAVILRYLPVERPEELVEEFIKRFDGCSFRCCAALAQRKFSTSISSLPA